MQIQIVNVLLSHVIKCHDWKYGCMNESWKKIWRQAVKNIQHFISIK